MSSPVKGLTPLRAGLAGFFTTLIFIMPGITNTPGPPTFTCFSITLVRQSSTATTSFLLTSVTSVMVLIMFVLVRGSLMDGNFLAAVLVLVAADLPFADFPFFFVVFFTAMFIPQLK